MLIVRALLCRNNMGTSRAFQIRRRNRSGTFSKCSPQLHEKPY